MLLAPSVVVAPKSLSVPSLTVIVPAVVSKFTAFRTRVPPPFLVKPPVVVAVIGVCRVKVSVALPSTRKTRSPVPPLVMPTPPVMTSAKAAPLLVARIPPAPFAALWMLRVCPAASVSVVAAPESLALSTNWAAAPGTVVFVLTSTLPARATVPATGIVFAAEVKPTSALP